MRRCGNNVLHEPHGDCDGRTRNESFVGQLVVEELRAALDAEQGRALVAVDIGGTFYPLRLIPDRPKGKPVFLLGVWRAER